MGEKREKWRDPLFTLPFLLGGAILKMEKGNSKHRGNIQGKEQLEQLRKRLKVSLKTSLSCLKIRAW